MRPARALLPLLPLILALVSALVVGPSLRAVDALRPASPALADPLELSPAMRAWLHGLGPLLGRPESRLETILRALVDPLAGGLREVSGVTRTASGALEAGEADCVSLAHLLVALGREAGVDARFVAARGPEAAHHQAGLRVEVWHLAAGVETRRGLVAFDFGGVSRPRPEEAEVVADARAASIYLSNRGAERLLAGDPAGALSWLRRAVAEDDEHLAAWVNLSVALRRVGRPEEARRAARRALDLANR